MKSFFNNPLSDIQRKVLRILCNYNHTHRRMPTLGELSIMTGSGESRLLRTLLALEELQYIMWIRGYTDTIVVIEEYERRSGYSRYVTSSNYLYGKI
ncbi:hypothetical protein BVG16_16225 [Paenibacillus selenitireducens]|uniref:LexA repressor DNA-binding domain-containing protein n=1 Tax=Paenibacillus selenitireducens TaxID=1324314 RepID=A0A1T2XAJ2_9BACL|nr:hypothetical protein BVG16_16225 [Paenibacillus selenitireducens]